MEIFGIGPSFRGCRVLGSFGVFVNGSIARARAYTIWMLVSYRGPWAFVLNGIGGAFSVSLGINTVSTMAAGVFICFGLSRWRLAGCGAGVFISICNMMGWMKVMDN